MRTWAVTLAALGLTGAIAIGSAEGASRSASIKIPLPGPNQVKVSEITVKITAPKGKRAGPLKVVATNSAALGSAQTNTQVIAAVSPPSSNTRTATFKIWVFIHRYQPVPATDHAASTASTVSADLRTSGNGIVTVKGFVDSQSCTQLKHELAPGLSRPFNFLNDGFPVKILRNLVATNDTAAEEQLDNAVLNHTPPCDGAEGIDDGST